MTAALDIRDLSVRYASKGFALDCVNLSIPKGSIVALLGANGAGKTTLIRSVSGLLPLHSGQITGGSVHMDGQSILNMASHKLVRKGMGQVPEGRLVFKQLTVEENELSLGLAPLIVSAIYKQLKMVGETLGASILVVEQNARLALDFASTAYVLERGRISLHGTAAEVAASDMVRESYLGVTQERAPS